MYVARARRDWYDDAIEQERRDPKWGGDNYTPARLFTAERIER